MQQALDVYFPSGYKICREDLHKLNDAQQAFVKAVFNFDSVNQLYISP